MAKSMEGDVTVFDIIEAGGKIVHAEKEHGLIFSWNGDGTFNVFMHAGKSIWNLTDSWTTMEPPRNLAEAVQRCKERMSEILADEASNEFHDAQVDKRKAVHNGRFWS